MNIIHEISSINEKFATKGSRLKIEKRGDKLNIRGRLPSKTNESISEVQRISLGLNADLFGLKEAEKKLQLISLQLELNQFEWKNWIKVSKNEINKNKQDDFIKKIDEFEKVFFKEIKSEFLNSTRKTTWKSSYKPYIKRMISVYKKSGELDLNKIFINTLKTYEKGSRSRKQCGTSLNVFASFMKHQLPSNWNLMSRGYGLKRASFRDLPNDDFIEELWSKIPNKSWQYVFALMATYGLRNHEVFFSDLSSLKKGGDNIIRILDTTKTGEHQAWPFHPKWVQTFKLYNLGENYSLLPKINTNLQESTLQNIGKRITEQFKRYQLKIKPYDLRHAYAVRTILYDLPDTVAARMMGHSVNLHTQTYHHWITKRDQQKAVNNAILKFNSRYS
tara:strand:- start:810 stop:1979 length:1170 start_codon:yes stop_codon:yes gene_type:complete